VSEQITEGIYVKKSYGKLGVGITAKESSIETFWIPSKASDGFVEMMLVTDNLERVLNLKEKVPMESLEKEYTLKEDSKELYQKLKESFPGS